MNDIFQPKEKRLGVIPSAGKGSRWGGYYKELLPIGNRRWLIDRAVHSMYFGGAEKVLVVSNPEKIGVHAKQLSKYIKVFFSTQRLHRDVYGAVYESLGFAKDINLFAMPDTIYPADCFKRDFSSSYFWLGCFETDEPERFGVLYEDKIHDKCEDFKGTIQNAWGVLVWHKKVADYWLSQDIKTNHDAINMAMKWFGYKTFKLDYYYDIMNWEKYVEFISKSDLISCT